MSINTFFGCCSLRTGTIIWGTITLIFDTIILSGIVVIVSKWENYSHYWGFCCIPFVIDQIISAGLVFGAVKEEKSWISVWLIVNGMLILAYVIGGTFTAIYVGYTCILLMCFGILMFIWISIFSYHRSLNTEFVDSVPVYTAVMFSKV